MPALPSTAREEAAVSCYLHAVTAPVADSLAAMDAALDVTCPLCNAQRDRYCENPLTQAPLHGGRTVHWQRISAARLARTRPQETDHA